MAAKTSWHRCGTKLRHCHLMCDQFCNWGRSLYWSSRAKCWTGLVTSPSSAEFSSESGKMDLSPNTSPSTDLWGRKKGTTFLLWTNLSIRHIIWQNLVVLFPLNIIFDVTFLISGIYINFRRLLCKKCAVGYYAINHGVMKLMIIG